MAARSTPVKRAWRTLTWLLVIVLGLVALNGAAVIWGGGSWTPKLALDLEGGTQIILAPQLEGGKSVTQEQLDQAVAIIRQRVNASGVSESEISTQSGQNVVVSIPGVPDQETMQRLEASAKLDFRPVLVTDVSATSAMGGEGEPSASPSPSAPAEAPATEPSVKPTSASDLNWITPALQQEFTNFTCDSIDEATMAVAPDDKPLITCDDTMQFKYILGPVEVSGERIADAQAALVANSQGVSTGQWGVNIVFDGEGTKEFGDVTKRLFQLQGSQNQFAVVLDGKVITAPTTNAVITDGKPQITGSFTQQSAKTLADQLKFGALPIGFVVQSQDTISATLGESQLASGLLAGLIGLILVVIYSLIQYRTLGFVTVVSLTVAALITYLLVTILSWREGYRLSLAGVAGLIVAVGITADSFIVYFERIRDELRDGRALVSAVEAGWKRALRTIFASDTVNFLAAAVLFLLAVGNVRGFAFTLGLTTLVDLFVVSMFTHPIMQLLAQTKYFGEGHRFSGLDPRALGAVYRGRAQFRDPIAVPASKRAKSSREAAKRQTIAERKAAEKVSSGSAGATSTSAKNSSAKKNAGKDS